MATATKILKDAWQDLLAHQSSVAGTDVLQAADVIRGFAGSWAAAYAMDYSSTSDVGVEEPRSPTPIQAKVSHLGQPGFPEINFAPYAYGTNRFGPKGGSLLGHPIAFSVVGPTLKNPAVNWQWVVTDNSGGAGGDVLTLDQTGGTIPNLYGISNLTRFHGGLYLVISQTGSTGTINTGINVDPGKYTTGAGGLGDGCPVNDPPDANYKGITPKNATSKFEIFRVVATTGTTFTLDPGKRIATYFTIPGGQNTPIVRGVMLIEPKATRLVAVPESGVTPRSERTFAVVPPFRALVQDDMPIQSTWVSNPWAEPGDIAPFQHGAGTSFEYNYHPRLPIPRVEGSVSFYLNGPNAAPLAAGHMKLLVFGDALADSLIGKVLRIHEVRVKGTVALLEDANGNSAPVGALSGFYECTAQNPNGADVTVRRVPEVNPTTGRSRIYPNAIFTADVAPTETDHIEMHATIHDAVDSLWTNQYADLDRIDSARLTNLIDPNWTERSAKQPSIYPAVTPARADRAVFDTRSSNSGAAGSNVDPGSLLDLGFRMVLFPATIGSIDTPAGPVDGCIPDWNRPLTSTEALLDPSKRTEKQYVDVGYSDGIVRLSHSVGRTGVLYPTTEDVFTSSDNPRGELVIFACCVPYSRETGQTGVGVRITGGRPVWTVESKCQGEPPECSEFADPHGDRFYGALTNQTVTASHQMGHDVTVRGLFRHAIPETGFVEILSGTDPDGSSAFSTIYARTSIFGYQSVSEDAQAVTTTLHDVYGGGVNNQQVVVDASHPAVAVWRREVITPNTPDGQAGVTYSYDTSYGSAKRAQALRFDDATVAQNADGSVTIRPRDTRARAQERLFDDLFSSWLIEGGLAGDGGAGNGVHNVDVASSVVIMGGIRREMAATTVGVPLNATSYVYYQKVQPGESCPTCTYSATLPLPDPEDVLIAKAVHANNALTLLDLRKPLLDVDRRAEIYVGMLGDASGAWAPNTFAPHFNMLKDAVAYAGEIMAPSSGIGRGSLRIRVVGPTIERDPIVIETDGLVIEGNPRRDTNQAATDYPEISWSANGALIDLNGHSDLVFRDVSFRSTYSNNGAVPAPGLARPVFTNTDAGTLHNLVIDNCRAVGWVDALLIATTGTFWHPKVTRNVGTQFVSAGVYFAGTSQVNYPTIEDNHLEADANANKASGYTGILISRYPANSAPQGVGARVHRNYVSGFNYGINVWTTGCTITENYVTGTARIGIIAGPDGLIVRDNFLLNVHSSAKEGTWDRRYGVVALAIVPASLLPCDVSGNRVHMHTAFTIADDFGMEVIVMGPSSVKTNILTYTNNNQVKNVPLWVYSSSSIVDGNSSSELLVWGAQNQIRGNVCSNLQVNYSKRDAVHRIPVASNYVAGNTVAWDGSTAEAYLSSLTVANGNRFAANPNNDTGGTYVYDNCKLVGNVIDHLKDFKSAPGNPWDDSDGVVLMGNEISAVGEDANHVIDYIFVGKSLTVIGNELGSVKFSTAGHSIIGHNRVKSLLQVGVLGTPVYATQVVGNFVEAGAAVPFVYVFAHQSTIQATSVIDEQNQTYVYGTITVTGDVNVVDGNHAGAIYTEGFNHTVTGNKASLIQLGTGPSNNVATGAKHVATGNVILDGEVLGQAQVAELWVADDHCVVTGNLTYNLTVADGVVGTVLVGNHTQVIRALPVGVPGAYIAVANRAVTVFGVNTGAGTEDSLNKNI